MNLEPKWTFGGDSGVVFGEAWSPTSEELALAGLEDGPRIWNLNTGELSQKISHPSLVSCLDWHPDGKRLVAGSSRGEVLVFDCRDGRLLNGTAGHSDEVRAVAFSPDGQLIASGANDALVRVWDASTLSLISTATGHGGLVRSVSWDPSGTRLASGSHDGTVRVWTAATCEAQGGLSDHASFVTKAVFSPDGRLLASSSADSTVRVWDLQQRSFACVLNDFDGWWVASLSFSPDSQALATIDQNSTIRIWQLDPVELLVMVPAFGTYTTVNWSPDGRLLASGGMSGEQVWTVNA